MALTTTTLGMQLPIPTTLEPFSTAKTNANFLILEAGIVADRVRLAAIELLPPALATPTLYARGQLADFTVADVAALEALSTAVVGDKAWMVTPGTGIDPMRWEAVSGTGAATKWQPCGMVIAATKANLDTFIAAIAATSDLRFEIGALSITTAASVLRRFTSAVGAYRSAIAGWRNLIPTTAVSGVTVDAVTGVVTISASTKLELDFVDAEFSDYRWEGDWVSASSVVQNMRLRSGGPASDRTGNEYASILVSASSAAVAASTTLASAANLLALAGVNANLHEMNAYMKQAADAAKQTEVNVRSTSRISPLAAATSAKIDRDLFHEVNVAITGFSITPTSGNITSGQFQVEGLVK